MLPSPLSVKLKAEVNGQRRGIARVSGDFLWEDSGRGFYMLQWRSHSITTYSTHSMTSTTTKPIYMKWTRKLTLWWCRKVPPDYCDHPNVGIKRFTISGRHCVTSSPCQFSRPFHVKWLRSRRCHAVRKRKDEEGEIRWWWGCSIISASTCCKGPHARMTVAVIFQATRW